MADTYLEWLAQDTPTAWWNDSGDPAEVQRALDHGAVGVTTNPFLSNVALVRNRTAWEADIAFVLAQNPEAETKAEELTRVVVTRAAAMVRHHFESSGGKHGYVCAQINPSRAGEREEMLAMARRFHAWAPNIAVKLPAVSAGLDVLEDCIAEGIPAAATVSFTLPQVLATAERCRAGRLRAGKIGVKPGECFSVIMIGRLDDYLREVALDNRIPVSESDIRQAGLAVTKRAYSIYRQFHYEAVLMIAALRGSYHLTELAGADLVMSIAPSAQEWFGTQDHALEEHIEQAIAPDVINRLLALPEFVKAYEPNGMTPKDFISYGATQRTLCQYVEAGWKLMETTN